MSAAIFAHHHHVTLCVDTAPADHAFHTRVLGLRNIKRTLLYDGHTPIYHLYYGNHDGDESTLLTTFAVGHCAKPARRGTGQFSSVDLSVPVTSIDWWESHLQDHGVALERTDRFGEPRLKFMNPGGVEYQLTGVAEDARPPKVSSPTVPSDHAIRGVHAITASVRDLELQQEFMEVGWGAREVARDRQFVRYEVGEGQSGALIDLVVEPDVKQGSWTFAPGSIHHCAFKVADMAAQGAVKARLEGMGFTDVSDVKDRGYFHSIYVRSPCGALFEATVSKPEGFLIDEPREALGTGIMIAPQFAAERESILARLDALPPPV